MDEEIELDPIYDDPRILEGDLLCKSCGENERAPGSTRCFDCLRLHYGPGGLGEGLGGE
jgi:hypothetical protein